MHWVVVESNILAMQGNASMNIEVCTLSILTETAENIIVY